MWLAKHQETRQVVGSYCVIPLRIKIGMDTVLGSLSLNTMTHPDYRKQGIFTTLAELTFQSCAEQDIHLTIGVSNLNTYFGFIKALGFSDTGTRLVLGKPLIVAPLLGKHIYSPRLRTIAAWLLSAPAQLLFPPVHPRQQKGLQIVELESFDARFDDLWNRVMTQRPNMILRDSLYLNWRFVQCPSRRYIIFAASRDDALQAYIVLRFLYSARLGCRVGYIVDLVVASQPDAHETCRQLVYMAEQRARAEEVALLLARFPSDTVAANGLLRSGYRNIPRKFLGRLDAIVIRCHTEAIVPAQVQRISDWYFTDGDNDAP
jgi:hypothetical protein